MNPDDGSDYLAPYRVAFMDWLACATAGQHERAPKAVAALGSDLLTEVAVAATAGHVLDFDDTLAGGVAHVSAPTAPAALVLAAQLGLTTGAALEAYARGYEAMAAVAEAAHPELYSRGWHPTTVCGPVGAAVAAATLLGLDARNRDTAIALALLRAGGSRGAFGSDGKAIQVGSAAAAGVRGALLVRAGARGGPESLLGAYGFASVFGIHWPDDLWDAARAPAIARNWIKLYPSCLGTHSPIEAADLAQAANGQFDWQVDEIEVSVHRVARQAAHIGVATDGLSAKFSIPYCVAETLVAGPPMLTSFDAVDDDVSALAARVQVSTDDSLPEFGAILRSNGRELARVVCPRGAPDNPVEEADLNSKIAGLAGARLDGVLDDFDRPARDVLSAAGLGALKVGSSK